jgi:hypothetical protein
MECHSDTPRHLILMLAETTSSNTKSSLGTEQVIPLIHTSHNGQGPNRGRKGSPVLWRIPICIRLIFTHIVLRIPVLCFFRAFSRRNPPRPHHSPRRHRSSYHPTLHFVSCLANSFNGQARWKNYWQSCMDSNNFSIVGGLALGLELGG